MTAKMAAIVIVLALCAPLVSSQQDDALDEALALVGMQRGDLGWEPKGWWPRFPVAPYKLRAFDALFAEPLDSVAFTRALAATAWEKLDPDELDARRERGVGNLFQAVQRLGIDPKFGGFRGYSANLIAPETPLDEAILELTRLAGRPVRIHTFGQDLPYPTPQEDLAEKVAALPPGVGPILGQLVLNVADAYHWAELAFRKVDGDDRAVVARRYNVGEEMIDAFDYCPEIDDVARTLDEASLWYAAQKSVQALDDARVALEGLDLSGAPEITFDWESPLGWIRIRGEGDDTVDGTDALLIVDLGGNDTYTGGVAASTSDRPLGLLLDVSGDDTYESDLPAQGAGLTGVGILLDAAGDDTYRARHYAQGVGQFGLGLLADLGGNDRYVNRYSGQGCGYFGIGLLFDAAGEDEYTLWADGQGLGGVSGVGVLADRTGNDTYTAVREHSVTGRPSYHSPGLDVGVSNAQGSGMGRRGDGADGHSWAGGLGALLDGRASRRWRERRVPRRRLHSGDGGPLLRWCSRRRGRQRQAPGRGELPQQPRVGARLHRRDPTRCRRRRSLPRAGRGPGLFDQSQRGGVDRHRRRRRLRDREGSAAGLRAQRREIPGAGRRLDLLRRHDVDRDLPGRRRTRHLLGRSRERHPLARSPRLAELEGSQLQRRGRPRQRPDRSDADPSPLTGSSLGFRHCEPTEASLAFQHPDRCV